MKAVLFDVDGTLLTPNIFHPQAVCITRALFETHGVEESVTDGLDWVGKTDFQLAREACVASAVVFDVGMFEAAYVRLFRIHCPRNLPVRLGMVEAVRELAELYDVRVVTGNITAVGVPKLKLAGFRGISYEKSAFGDQAELRGDIVRLAAGADRCVMVGDTYRDVEAAKANGIPCVALQTPKHPAHELRAAQHVVDSPAAVVAAVRSILGKRNPA